MNTFRRIKRIADNVRMWAEEMQDRNQRWDEDLSCMCGIASYELFKRLKRAGLKPTMCFANVGHAFIQCKGYTIDVTATQFYGMYYKDSEDEESLGEWEAVEIRPADEAPKAAQFWDVYIKAKGDKAILKIFEDWPAYQVHPTLLRKINRHAKISQSSF